MINLGATRGVYRYDIPNDLIAYRAVGKLTAKALHDPRIDKDAFHPLHWRYCGGDATSALRGIRAISRPI